MSFPLQHNVANQIILLGPFCTFDEDDNLIPANSLTIAATDIKIRKAGATTEVNTSAGASHVADGRYVCTLNANDCDTLGPMEVSIYLEGVLPFTLQCEVLTEAAYKLRYGTGTIDGIETLKTRVPGTVRTAAQDDTADSALTTSIASAATAAGNAQSAAQAAATAAGDVSGRLTTARAALLDKLDVTGNLSTFDPAIHHVIFDQAFPDNFQLMQIDGSGKVTTSNPAAGGDNIWSTGQRDQVLALASSYVAPNNDAILAIKGKTDNLPTVPASASDLNINFNPVINVNPTVLSQASVDAITDPIVTAINDIEVGEGGGGTGGPTVDQIAARLFADPSNKLYVSAEGYVIASNAGGGTGLYEVSVFVIDENGDGIENVIVFIPGTARQYKTDMYGIVTINLNNGSYILSFDASAVGFEDPDDVLLGVQDQEEQVEVILVRKAADPGQPVGTIKLPLRLLDQSNQPLQFIRVNAVLADQYEVVDDDGLALNATSNKLTDANGKVNLYLLPSTAYIIRVIMPDLTEVTVPITTPEQGVAILRQVIQV